MTKRKKETVSKSKAKPKSQTKEPASPPTMLSIEGPEPSQVAGAVRAVIEESLVRVIELFPTGSRGQDFGCEAMKVLQELVKSKINVGHVVEGCTFTCGPCYESAAESYVSAAEFKGKSYGTLVKDSKFTCSLTESV